MDTEKRYMLNIVSVSYYCTKYQFGNYNDHHFHHNFTRTCYQLTMYFMLFAQTLCFKCSFFQKESETPDLKKGAIKAVQDLYDVMRYDFLSVIMRFAYFLLVYELSLFFALFGEVSYMEYNAGRTMMIGIYCQKQGLKVVCLQT